MNHFGAIRAALFAACLAAPAAHAAPIAYSFSGTLAQSLGGGNSVTAAFTYDAVDGSFQGSVVTPFATFDDGNFSGSMAFTGASPTGDFQGFFFNGVDSVGRITSVGLIFNAAGNAFFTGLIDGSQGERVQSSVRAGSGDSLFASGTVSATPVPEPASLALLSVGFLGLAGAVRGRRRVGAPVAA